MPTTVAMATGVPSAAQRSRVSRTSLTALSATVPLRLCLETCRGSARSRRRRSPPRARSAPSPARPPRSYRRPGRRPRRQPESAPSPRVWRQATSSARMATAISSCDDGPEVEPGRRADAQHGLLVEPAGAQLGEDGRGALRARHEPDVAGARAERGGKELLVAVAHGRDDDGVRPFDAVVADPPADGARERRRACARPGSRPRSRGVERELLARSAPRRPPPRRSRPPCGRAAARGRRARGAPRGRRSARSRRRRSSRVTRPSGVTSARSPRRAEAGRTTLTTVASA